MNNNLTQQWQQMFSQWQDAQLTMAKNATQSTQQWYQLFNTPSQTQNNPTLAILEYFTKALALPTANEHWQSLLSQLPASANMIEQTCELFKTSQDILEKIKADFIEQLPDQETQNYYKDTLDKLANPLSWLQSSHLFFKDGYQGFSQGPAFSGISDIDQRLAKATDSWLLLGEKGQAYYDILLGAWMRAYEKFLKASQTISQNAPKGASPKQLFELWSNIADAELMEVHRSDAFLSAQKQFITAGAQYRIHEQNIAEILCKMLHIPTRQEVDDLHKTVAELRREVRSLKKTHTSKNTRKKTTATAKAATPAQ